MCRLKEAIVSQRAGALETQALNSAAAEMQEAAQRIHLRHGDPDLDRAADNSSTIYRAISRFYAGDMAGAHDAFHAVATAATGEQSARAYNNAGFAAFVLANFDDASKDLDDAYDQRPNWPYIRANRAYLSLALGKVDAAKNAFDEIASDLTLAQNSSQDVALAKIMLLELAHDGGASLDVTNRGYAALLKTKGAATWDDEADARLRYALLVDEVVAHIYLNGDYLGMEMFALTAACKAMVVLTPA